MRAAVLRAVNTPISIERVRLDAPRRGEVLVRIAASGVCRSDYSVLAGKTNHPLPVVLGHEGAGIVEAVGPDVTRVRPGDHVVLSWAPDCGECFYCLRGRPALCEAFTGPLWAGTLLDGETRLHNHGKDLYHLSGLATFAERAVVLQEACVPIRQEIPLEVAALVGCAVTSGFGAATNTVHVQPGDSVVVFGCGGTGLNILQGAALRGANPIIAVDQDPDKTRLAATFGATHTFLPRNDIYSTVKQLTGGRGADFAFEAIGLPKVQQTAFQMLRPGGTLVLVGIAPVGSSTGFPADVVTRQEKRIVGSYYGSSNPRQDFPLILDLYLAGKLKLEELISRVYRLEEINTAFEEMCTGKLIRGVITFP